MLNKLTTSFKLLLILVLVASIEPVLAKQVKSIRIWHSPDSTRVVFDVDSAVKYDLLTLENPRRYVVDIYDAQFVGQLPVLDPANRHFVSIHNGQFEANKLRFVFKLKQNLKPDVFSLQPNNVYGHRLVVDFDEVELTTQTPIKQPQPTPQSPTSSTTHAPQPTSSVVASQQKKLVVAIDAGHGGEDPGARGHRGSREKNLTLAISKKLEAIIDSDPNMDAFLVRKSDYFIGLHKRRSIARKNNADIFISIHADAFKKRSASGSSVFALSQRGATSAMARALAQKENESDLIGGVRLSDKDDMLQEVLVDLSMTNTKAESINLAGRVLKELSRLGKLHSKKVEQAGFAVLKSADIPSILVETGFITNPDEERKLRSTSYQNQVARAIYRAVIGYNQQTPHHANSYYDSPSVSSGSSPSKKTSTSSRSSTNKTTSTVYHEVRRGDSLSKISKKYNVTISAIKRANNLKRNTVMLGQKLKVPGVKVSAVKRTGYRYHKVKRGDTLSDIAQSYGSTMTKIMRANKMRRKTVMLGQTLKIPY